MIFHVILAAKLIIKSLFPEIPRSVSLLNLKQANMVHRCLENIKVEPQQDFSLFRQHGADSFEIMEQDMEQDLFDDDNVEPGISFMESMKVFRDDLSAALDK